MKTYIYILVLGLMVSACTTDKKQTVISVLEDVTETDFSVTPESKTILSQFKLDHDPWQGAEFRYGNISSLIHNERVTYKLPPKVALFSNEIQRKTAVKQFKTQIAETLKRDSYIAEHRYSAIWTPLVEELISLQTIPNGEATLYLFSDLQENNPDWFSVLTYEDVIQLERNRQSVVDQFVSRADGIKRGNKHIKVIVVFQPQNMKEDATFSKMKQLYTAIFKELGISIDFITKLQTS